MTLLIIQNFNSQLGHSLKIVKGPGNILVGYWALDALLTLIPVYKHEFDATCITYFPLFYTSSHKIHNTHKYIDHWL